MTSDMRGSACAGSPALAAPFPGWGPPHARCPPGPLRTRCAADAGRTRSLCINSALSHVTQKGAIMGAMTYNELQGSHALSL